MALSATIVTVNPGIARAVDVAATTRPPGWDVGTVRFEPLEAGPAGLTVAGIGTYRGALEVRRHGRSLAVVNEVGTEDYLRGIDEVPSTWPAAALQAQVIAARTYAAHLAGTGATSTWREVGADICATDSCQVYKGLDAERHSSGTGWAAAVEATASRVLLAANEPIRASYTASTSGPRTMSQEGARAMAAQGRSANEILAAYYGGIRPTVAPNRVPGALRVALSMTSSSVRISANGPFRVIDGSGAELAISAGGEWSIVPGSQGVRVVPPEPQPRYLSLIVPAAPVDATAAATVTIRRPARVISATAVASPSRRRPWALLAASLILLAGTAAIILADRPPRAFAAGRGAARDRG